MDEVAPGIGLPFFLHWKARGAVPVAATEKEADWPATTVWLTGCVVIEGGKPDRLL